MVLEPYFGGKLCVCGLRTISRGKGNSVVDADAYISGEKLRDNYVDKIHDRSYRQDVAYKEILLPFQAPREFLDRQIWLNELNRAEKRCDAQMARTIKIALPNELTLEDQIALAKEFILEKVLR